MQINIDISHDFNNYIELCIRQLLIKISNDYNINYYSLLSSINNFNDEIISS